MGLDLTYEFSLICFTWFKTWCFSPRNRRFRRLFYRHLRKLTACGQRSSAVIHVWVLINGLVLLGKSEHCKPWCSHVFTIGFRGGKVPLCQLSHEPSRSLPHHAVHAILDIAEFEVNSIVGINMQRNRRMDGRLRPQQRGVASRNHVWSLKSMGKSSVQLRWRSGITMVPRVCCKFCVKPII